MMTSGCINPRRVWRCRCGRSRRQQAAAHRIAVRWQDRRCKSATSHFSEERLNPMNSEQNIFISYAHIDDQPLTPVEKGWITRFHATLKAILSMRLGREAKIWRDEKLQGNDVFSNEIVAQFKQS